MLKTGLGGQTTVGRAALSSGMDVGTGAAIDHGAGSIYDGGRGAMSGDLNTDERRGVQERGFE